MTTTVPKQCVILAGGKGTRLAEETSQIPKPMVEIGGKPILWHIMKYFYSFGVEEFIICLGYRGYVIKEYFANYTLHNSNVTFDFKEDRIETHENSAENWRVSLVDTGMETMTGGRLKRILNYLGNDDFFFTYGDGLGNIDLATLVKLHKRSGRLATVTATNPPNRFGAMSIENTRVTKFKEKPVGDGSWINGGFFVLAPEVIEFITDDETIWESTPMQRLAKASQLSVYKHSGFWQPMDTLAEKILLNRLWDSGEAPWRVWS